MHYNFQTKKGIAISAIVKLPQVVQKALLNLHTPLPMNHNARTLHSISHAICSLNR